MNKVTNYFSLGAMVLLTGCATTDEMGGGYGARYNPIVDGKQDAKYFSDLTECRNLAAQVEKTKNKQILTEAIVGGVVGGVVGAAVGGTGNGFPEYGAKVGAAAGAADAAGDALTTGKMVIIRCMTGRGHKVLG